MDTLERKIIDLLTLNEKLKAKEIADKLGITRREANQCLYYKLNDACVKDDFNFWSLKKPPTPSLKVLPFKSLLVITKKDRCLANHPLEQMDVMIEIVGFTGKIYREKASVRYCKECGVYFITKLEYENLREIGVLLCRVISGERYESGDYDIAEDDKLSNESLLHQFGYNVMASPKALTEEQRHEILKRVVDNEVYKKQQLLYFLNWLIDKNCAKPGMQSALKKWQDDIKYISNNL